MSAAAILLFSILGFWAVGGSVWLLTRRRYRLSQAPQFAMDLLGFPVELAQSLFGRSGVPYAFLLPNMLIFGLFTFLPVILNFYVSLTGGSSVSVFDRPFVGWDNYREIFACRSILDPSSCRNAGYNFWASLGNTLWFVLFQVPVLVFFALITALVVNRAMAGRGFWRAMFFYPVMLSPVVIANVWKWSLHRRGILNESLAAGAKGMTALAGMSGFNLSMAVLFGVLLLVSIERTIRAGRTASLAWGGVAGGVFVLLALWADPLRTLGFGSILPAAALAACWLWLVARDSPWVRSAALALSAASVTLLLLVQFDAVFDLSGFRPINWLVTPNTGWPFFWVVFVFCWAHMGFYMLILLAGLQAIPKDLYEAAEMDGTTPVRIFFRITLPLLMPTLTVVLILSLIRSFQVFDDVYLLTGGGPGRETFMIVQNIFEGAFAGTSPLYGLAAAGSVLMAIIIAAFTAVQLVLTRKRSGI
jgi:ABC-type sugar transport system permease subunit